MTNCFFSDLGCPNEAVKPKGKKPEMPYCDYHKKEFEHYSKVLKKLPNLWTEEEREEFHLKYGFKNKPMQFMQEEKDLKKLKISLLVKTAVYAFLIGVGIVIIKSLF